MKLAPPYCYSFDGRLFVGADGHEIVGYDGQTEAPLWIFDHHEPIRWVFIDEDFGVLAICDSTVLHLSDDGEVVSTFVIPSQFVDPIAADYCPLFGEFCIATEEGVWVSDFDSTDAARIVQVRDSIDIAIASSGELVTLSSDGTVRKFDHDGHLATVLQPRDVGYQFSSVASGEDGWWLVAGPEIFLWNEGALELIFGLDGNEAESIYAYEDVSFVGIRTVDGAALVYTTEGGRLMEIIYPDREVGAIYFAGQSWVGIGLDLADSNKVNLLTSALHRSDTHAEREHNSWVASLSVDERAAKQWLESQQEQTETELGSDWVVSTGDPMTFKEELEAFHRKLMGLSDEAIGQHLRNGPLPSTAQECILAAQRTIPMLEGKSTDTEPAESARVRLRAIRRLMDLYPDQSTEMLMVIKQMDDVIRDSERVARNDNILGCGCLSIIALAVILPAIYYIVF